ncbi:MAG TPA: STAS domain-containing protein [Solirubrobacteraceae bacterium]|nr:STAS domain-containing protein [Solirubrobacteraceae bacterium]
MPGTPFEINVVRDRASATVTLAGELDIATVPRVEEAIEATLTDEVQQLTVDLSGLGFVDSSGLRLFIVLDQRAAEQGWELRLLRPDAQVLTVFQVSGVEENLPFVEDASVT